MFADRRIGFALVLPALLFIGVGFILPVGVLLAGSFRPSGSWTFDAYTRFFANALNQEVF